jgi:hypothetical protein
MGAPNLESNPEATRIASLVGAITDLKSGQNYQVYDGMIFGRTEGDIKFPSDQLASRQHMKLTVAGVKVSVTDLKSANGTFVNDIRIAAEVPVVLKPGDKVRFGNQVLVFDLAGAPAPMRAVHSMPVAAVIEEEPEALFTDPRTWLSSTKLVCFWYLALTVAFVGGLFIKTTGVQNLPHDTSTLRLSFAAQQIGFLVYWTWLHVKAMNGKVQRGSAEQIFTLVVVVAGTWISLSTGLLSAQVENLITAACRDGVTPECTQTVKTWKKVSLSSQFKAEMKQYLHPSGQSQGAQQAPSMQQVQAVQQPVSMQQIQAMQQPAGAPQAPGMQQQAPGMAPQQAPGGMQQPPAGVQSH